MITASAGTLVRSETLTSDFPATPSGWPYKNPFDFMDGKRKDDGIPSNFHRVHDKLYDLSGFDHPGGALWLNLTKGTDVTELFESHHLNYHKASAILAKYETKSDRSLPPRRSPFTFHSDGFYATLRTKIWKHLDSVAILGPSFEAIAFADTLAIVSVLLNYLAGVNAATGLMHGAVCVTVILGILNGFFIGIGHNFMHQKSNWRRYYMDLSGFSCAEFRMHHALSHHPYTNTIMDAEINSLLSLGVSFFPHRKSVLSRIKAVAGLIFLITFGIPIRQLTRFYQILNGTWRGEYEDKVAQVIPLIQLAFLSAFSFENIFYGALLWLLMLCVTSSAFLWGNFLNGPHFNDECWHQGDTLDSSDWGILQVQTNVERSELSSKNNLASNLFNIITFNLHHLHHLFPTIDATYLSQLVPIFEKHCGEHGVVFNTMDNYSLARGLWRCIILGYDEPSQRTRNGIRLSTHKKRE